MDKPDIAALADGCHNCGKPRWKHHYFSEYGFLCPGNLGVGKFTSPAAPEIQHDQ